MKILIYNIAYSTGAPKGKFHAFFSLGRFLCNSTHHFFKLKEFIKNETPDLVGLVEVDSGSYRNNFSCQAAQLAKELDFVAHSRNKYHTGFFHLAPVFSSQANAILTRENFVGNFHFFRNGMKRLIIEVECAKFSLYLVHLALSKKVREKQLLYLENILNKSTKAKIVAGDFNTFSGEKELKNFLKNCNLLNANLEKIPSFPVWQPKHQLDYILHSPELKLKNFKILDNIKLSDHLPIIAEFE